MARLSRTRLALAVAAAALSVVGVIGAVTADAASGSRVAVAAELPLPRFAEPVPMPTTTTTSTTTTAPPPEPLPQPIVLRTPEAPPADERAAEPVVVLGTIEIPKLGLSVPLNQGIALSTIDRGPSHWPGTALPGERGNVVVAGHRVTRTHPFRHIDDLVAGDEVVFTVGGVRSVYRVTGSEIVTPDAMHIVQQTPDAVVTLFACHPPGSARYRYVVRAALEGEPASTATPA